MHSGMRIEQAAAQIVCQQANMNRSKGTPPWKMHEFMPHTDKPELTMEQAMEAWG
ncbi:hypothetical protein [Vreelandella aquamarina]|uniref:hypothetical protein n=1 Tax=Vreelandella aquamarina TaxID=77097 RepID=UPI003CC918A5